MSIMYTIGYGMGSLFAAGFVSFGIVEVSHSIHEGWQRRKIRETGSDPSTPLKSHTLEVFLNNQSRGDYPRFQLSEDCPFCDNYGPHLLVRRDRVERKERGSIDDVFVHRMWRECVACRNAWMEEVSREVHPRRPVSSPDESWVTPSEAAMIRTAFESNPVRSRAISPILPGVEEALKTASGLYKQALDAGDAVTVGRLRTRIYALEDIRNVLRGQM